jgi:hypothetical protein
MDYTHMLLTHFLCYPECITAGGFKHIIQNIYIKKWSDVKNKHEHYYIYIVPFYYIYLSVKKTCVAHISHANV